MDNIIKAIRHVLLENMPGYSYGPAAMFIYNLLICALLAFLLGVVYKRYGVSLSNRNHFGRIFPLLACATMIVITFVKSSLALSLGLVGALSIIRFRSAIKEPEELAYLFVCIAIGIGSGAGFSTLTIIAFIILCAIIILLRAKRSSLANSVYLNVSGKTSHKDLAQKIDEVLKMKSVEFKLKRYDWSGESFDFSYEVVFDQLQLLEEARDSVLALDEEISFSYLDSGREF